MWEDWRRNDGDLWHRDIYGYRISTTEEFIISSSPETLTRTTMGPAIHGNTVVWTDFRNGGLNSGDIYGAVLILEPGTLALLGLGGLALAARKRRRNHREKKND